MQASGQSVPLNQSRMLPKILILNVLKRIIFGTRSAIKSSDEVQLVKECSSAHEEQDWMAGFDYGAGLRSGANHSLERFRPRRLRLGVSRMGQLTDDWSGQ